MEKTNCACVNVVDVVFVVIWNLFEDLINAVVEV